MNKEEIDKLVERYFKKDKYQFPKHFECRYDEEASKVCYSLIRYFKPRKCLEIGLWYGGSTCFILSALIKNDRAFYYVASELLDDLRTKTCENVMAKCGQIPVLVSAIQANLDKVPAGLDFLFVDTDHDLTTTEWIVDNVFPRVTKGGLVAIHDFAVEEIDGKWVGKGEGGKGGLPETQYYMDLHEQERLPLQKLYWMYENAHPRTRFSEASFWLKI